MSKSRVYLLAFMAALATAVDWGLMLVTLVFYIKHFGGSTQTYAAVATFFMIIQFLATPFWGRLSDRHGRKTVLLVGFFGMLASMLLMATASSLEMVIGGRILGALFTGSVPILMATIADQTTMETRAKSIGLVEAGVSCGMFLIGPLAGGHLYQVSPELPYALGAIFCVVNVVLALLFIPKQTSVSATSANSAAKEKRPLRQTLKLFFTRPVLVGGLALMLFMGLAKAPYEVCLALYMKAFAGYTSREVGQMISLFGVSVVLIQTFLFGRLVRRLDEIQVAAIGMIIGGFGAFLMVCIGLKVLPADPILLGVLMVIDAFGFGLVVPSGASIVSKACPSPDLKGTAMGTFRASNSLGKFSSPLLGYMFDHVNILSPFMFSVGAWFTGLVFVATWKWGYKPQEESISETSASVAEEKPAA